ncbi:MAG: glycosyltransferase family 1 protein [Dehalococcoidia bacterium]
MHIAIDAVWLGDRQGAGLATYTTNLLESLAKVDSRNRYTVYSMRLETGKLSIENDNFTIKEVPDLLSFLPFWYSWTFWYYTGFSAQLSLDKPDLFLSTHPALPLYHPYPRVVIIYDLTPVVLKGAHRADFRFKFGKEVSHAARRANKIIAISQSTKKDLINLLGAKPEKISVVYPGYDDDIFKPSPDPHKVETALRKYGIVSSYIIYVGILEPKKNILRLVEAFASLKRDGKIVHKLVIAGKRAWGDEKVFQAVRRNGLEGEVIFTGYVPQEELPLLMSGADVFVFPSLHEGFGIPPLEAMACGAPVITSNASSLPEVVGDAGILVDPYNVDEIAEAIYKVVSDGKLREQMRRKGLERAKLFSWKKAAQQTLQILEDTYSSRHIHTKA